MKAREVIYIRDRQTGGSPERAREEAKQAFAKTTANKLAFVPVLPVPDPWSEGKGWVRSPPSVGSHHF